MGTYYLIITYVLAGIVGLCVGSFLNVVIYRVPLHMNIAKPASHCPGCNNPIAWYDNIPILSYVLLGGKCRHCKTHISFRYTAVEAANMLLWLLAVRCFYAKSPVYMGLAMATASILICVFFIDLEHQIIMDRFQLILLGLALAAAVFDPSAFDGGKQWYSNLIGAVAAFCVFFLISFVGEKIAGREALGGGDIKLAGIMGLFLGWQKLLLAMLLASVVGSVILLILKKKQAKEEEAKVYPFAPFLTSGFAVAIFFGDWIINAYGSLLGIGL